MSEAVNKVELVNDITSRTRKCIITALESHKLNDGEDSNSNNGLVIDDDFEEAPVILKKRQKGVRLSEEPVNIECKWLDCVQQFQNYNKYIAHAEKHCEKIETDEDDGYSCGFRKCTHKTPHLFNLFKHVAYHTFHERLKNIGQNVTDRLKLPKCIQGTHFEVPAVNYDYNCEWEKCRDIFGTLHEYISHLRFHIGRNPKHCMKNEYIYCKWKGCKSKFSSQYKLLDHVRSHTKEKTIACPTCGTMFATKTKFVDHRKRQIPMELHSYQCSECSKLFASERLLRDHIRSHINHYKCTMCDMTCPKPSVLARHIRIRHLDERHYKCTLCEQTCSSKCNLEQHLATHCADKLMACDECDYKCRSVYGLDRHCQIVHGQGTPPVYECHCCKKSFHRGGHLTRHLIDKHGFSWPSGHSRFRYKEDTDGIYRLYTVRYESLEVTQQMLKFTPPINKNIKYDILKCSDSKSDVPSFALVLNEVEEGEEEGEDNEVDNDINTEETATKEIIITINDVDESGIIIKSEVVNSNEFSSDELINEDLVVDYDYPE